MLPNPRGCASAGLTRQFPLYRRVKGGIRLPQVQIRDNESLENALKRFKRSLQQHGVLEEARRHERYEKPSDRRRRLAAASERRRRKANSRNNG